MKKLGLLKENKGVSVVALTPDNVRLLSKNFSICVESGAGELAGFSDQAYELAGATLTPKRIDVIKDSAILVTHSSKIDVSSYNEKKVIIACHSVLDEFTSVLQFSDKLIDFYSLTLLPRTTKAQSMDILSSLAAISGYQAVIQGFDRSNIVSPMISSAGGTLYPAKVLVLGAGVAGLQAIATAKRLGAVVHAFDIRKQTQSEVESLGATFIEVEGAKEDETSGGYAIEQDETFVAKVQNSIAKFSQDADLVITTAKIPGKKAPILITNEMLSQMKAGSVIVDLASDTGGNCESTKNNEEILVDGVVLIGDAAIYNKVAQSASILLGNNISTFIAHFDTNETVSFNDEILSSTLVTKNGKIVHQKLRVEIINY